MIKKYIVTWDMLQIYTRSLSKRLIFKKKWKGIIAVSRGGLIPATLLARELSIRYIDTVCIASYNNRNQNDIKILKYNKSNGKNFLVVDDLVDTGNTAKTIRLIYPKGYFITIFAKPAGKLLVDDYFMDIPQNIWLEQPWDTGITYMKPLIKDNF